MDENQELKILKKENEQLRKEIEEIKSKLKDSQNKRGQQQKLGMIKKAAKGNPMSRPAFGYKFSNQGLVLTENFREVEEIFEDFLQKDMNLTKLAKKHNFSVNGLKKILTNFTYIGKIKFNGQIHEGKHQPIISSTLFNKVQDKLDRLRKK